MRMPHQLTMNLVASSSPERLSLAVPVRYSLWGVLVLYLYLPFIIFSLFCQMRGFTALIVKFLDWKGNNMSGNNASLSRDVIRCKKLYADNVVNSTSISSGGNDITGAWTQFTPTITNGSQRAHASTVTIGRYKQIGKTVHVAYYLSHEGGVGSASGVMYLSLPVPASTTTPGVIPGSVFIESTTATSGTGFIGVAMVGPTDVYFNIINRDTPSVSQIVSDADVPNLGEAKFELVAQITYEAA